MVLPWSPGTISLPSAMQRFISRQGNWLALSESRRPIASLARPMLKPLKLIKAQVHESVTTGVRMDLSFYQSDNTEEFFMRNTQVLSQELPPQDPDHWSHRVMGDQNFRTTQGPLAW